MLKVHSEEIRFVSVWLFDFEQVFNYLVSNSFLRKQPTKLYLKFN